MKGRKLDFHQVVESLSKKGVTINSHSRTVDIQATSNLGNSSWGMIDFLVNHNNYRLVKGIEVIK